MTEQQENEFMPIAISIANLVKEKNLAYGDAFGKSGEILKTLFPNGVAPEQYDNMLTIVRVLDKLFRIATDKDAFGENPWRDIGGYSLLAVRQERKGAQGMICKKCKYTVGSPGCAKRIQQEWAGEIVTCFEAGDE